MSSSDPSQPQVEFHGRGCRVRGQHEKRMTPCLISGIENSADANETFGTKGNRGFV
jgi:hypothetical protein